MKAILSIACLVLAFLWVRERNRANEAMAKLEALEASSEEVVTETPVVPAVSAAETVDAPPQEPVDDTSHLAAEGTYYLLTDLAIEDGDSLTGFRAGTKVI